MAYRAQLAWKRDEVMRAVRTGLGRPVQVAELLAPEEPRGHRTKIGLRIGGAAGALTAGLFAPHTREVVAISECEVQDAAGTAFALRLVALASKLGVPPFEEESGRGLLRAVVVRVGHGTGELQVVERSNVGAVLSEQEMAELGIVKKGPNAARKGQMTGARYIVLGTVTSYETNVEEKGSGSNFGLMGFGKNQEQLETKDYVAIDIRVVDSSTGEVVGSRTVEGRASNVAAAKESGVNLLPAAGAALLLFPNMGRTGQVLTGAAGTLNFGNRSSEAQRTPAAKAIRAALTEASDYVSCVLAPRGNCLAKFEAKDQLRRERNNGVLKLD